MTQKSCSNCSGPAQFSMNIVVSTVGVSRRLQHSSSSVAFCPECLRELIDQICSAPLSLAVNSAYTRLNQQLEARSTTVDSSEGELSSR